MRWDQQGIALDDPDALPGLGKISSLLRTVTTPDFAGVRFHEVAAKSALSKVPAPSGMPFDWTINPYRGCTHACVYCYARGSHSWLELDTGRGFDTEIVVKVNIAEVLGRELARPSWGHEPVALGTNTDPYQRAEGRYRLMPGIIAALARSGTPLSILTKGTLLRRDLPLLQAAAQEVSVGLAISIAIVEEDLQPSLEPGTPSVRARLDLVRALTEAGLPCGVFVAPVLPYLTDTDEHLDRLLGQVAAAGATGCTVVPLHLRPGAREWFFSWLRRERPKLIPVYEQIFGRGSYVGADYRRALARKAGPILDRHGLRRRDRASRRGIGADGVPGDTDANFPEGALPAPGGRPRPVCAVPVAEQLTLVGADACVPWVMPGTPFTHLVTNETDLRDDGYPEPPARAWAKEIDALDEHCAGFLRRSPLGMLATSDARGRTTVTPRGGQPGFARVLDAKRLAWADLTGNRRIDAFRQILENPQVGLLFLIPGMRETLRVDGTAYLTRDPAVLRAVDVPGRMADLAVGVHVRTAFVHCGKAMIRSQVWEPDSWPAREELPSAAAMLLAARGERTPVEHVAATLEAGYTTQLW